jgi:hypothetical protein
MLGKTRTRRQRFVETYPQPESDRCGECGFVFSDGPTRLSRRLSNTLVGYERTTFAVFAASSFGDENIRSMLDQVVHVRDGLFRYTTWLERLADTDYPVFSDLDPEPIQPVALDCTWGAVTGLITNIHLLAGVIASFPTHRWYHRGVLNGYPVTALKLANYGVHEAHHHLCAMANECRTPSRRAGLLTTATGIGPGR